MKGNEKKIYNAYVLNQKKRDKQSFNKKRVSKDLAQLLQKNKKSYKKSNRSDKF